MKKFLKILTSSALFVCIFTNTFASINAEEWNSSSNMEDSAFKTGGWADYGSGTTGGAEASDEHIFVVTNKKELLNALDGGVNGNSDTPKIIYIKGTIDINVDENNNPVGREYYADPEYNLDAYLEAYNPENWGWGPLHGPQEEARIRSQRFQASEVKLHVGSNTSIIGLGDNARVKGGSFIVSRVENVIIQNLHIEAPVDFFPEWDPEDGALGDWNSEYDAIQINHGAEHVWVNHNTLTEATHPDQIGGYMFGRLFMEYDGLVDITNGSNYVTVSYNIFSDFDKVSLIGGSNSRLEDRGKLKVTMHNNYFYNTMERTPRIRFGEVHVYNNYYEITDDGKYPFVYTWGVGVESKGYYENNYFSTTQSVDPSKMIKVWGGTDIYESGTYLNGKPVDLTALHNAANPTEAVGNNVGWTPSFFNEIKPTQEVPQYVKANAGVQLR